MLYFMFATPKRHILWRNGVFWRILRQNPSRALGCSELQEPKKNNKLTRFGAQSHACAETTRMGGSWRTFAQMYGSMTSPVPICITIAYGVWAWRGRGSNFGFLHWLASSHLQRSRSGKWGSRCVISNFDVVGNLILNVNVNVKLNLNLPSIPAMLWVYWWRRGLIVLTLRVHSWRAICKRQLSFLLLLSYII